MSPCSKSPKATIILADDDTLLRAALGRLLQHSGYRILEAENGLGVLRHLADESAALVITDMLMPEMEGVETIKVVRRNHPAVKIIAISAGGLISAEDYLSLARGLGADATLAKPVLARELLATIARLLTPCEPQNPQ